uniref:Peroxisomal membrane protein PEX14 n=1 Tax=Culicoides sonorensis TaxID=179676 RepID=A0A336LKS2_CULSO
MENISKSDETSNVRESLIITAINFLTNPNVKRSTLTQKQSFLRNKGLTDKEIEIASNRAGIYYPDGSAPNFKTHTIINMDRQHNSYVVQPKMETLSRFSKIKEFLKSMALFSGIMYTVYMVYQNFIKTLLTGQNKQKTIEQKLEEFTNKVENDLKILFDNVNSLKEDISKNKEIESVKLDIQTIQQDVDKIRGLLLNKKQFANPTLQSIIPSIPQWQIDARRSVDLEERDKNEDANSGSGSSETENVTKNSDSSLEIM